MQLRGDGVLSVLDRDGRRLAGWPLASGSPGNDGPLRLKGADGDERWYVSHAVSDTSAGISALPFGRATPLVIVEDCPGCFPAPLAGPARAGVYPSSLVPAPREAASFLDPALVILHPNPVRSEGLKIRYVLGAGAQMEATAFDLSGREKARALWEGHAGAEGETYLWDLRELASGAYLVRLRARGAGQTSTVKRMVAVVR